MSRPPSSSASMGSISGRVSAMAATSLTVSAGMLPPVLTACCALGSGLTR